jgi:hypothetical protein
MTIGFYLLSAWALGVSMAILARHILDVRREKRTEQIPEAAKRMNDKIVADNYVRSPFKNAQMLHEFNKKNGTGNAEIVQLRRGKV